MYADHKKMDLKEVEVKLTHDKVHKNDGENSESSQGKIDQITRRIKLTGELTEEQRRRLIEIANKCPVHRTIEGKPEILTEEIKETFT
jgi:putative redox protein